MPLIFTIYRNFAFNPIFPVIMFLNPWRYYEQDRNKNEQHILSFCDILPDIL